MDWVSADNLAMDILLGLTLLEDSNPTTDEEKQCVMDILKDHGVWSEEECGDGSE